MKTKPFYFSKINWLGFLMIILGITTDQEFIDCIGQFIPPKYVNLITFFSGWLVIYFRSNPLPNYPLTLKKKEELK